jgi:transcriptional regulator with XRE-family HTH domain
MIQNQAYNLGQSPSTAPWMPKKQLDNLTDFGARLALLRKAAGYTQMELAKEIGVSQRVIAYYEGETQHPPANLLPKLAQALNITTDELLGIKPVNKAPKADSRLQRRFRQIEKMDAREKRQIIQLLDTFIEREQLRRKAEGG